MADPRRIRDLLGYDAVAAALTPFHAGMDPQYMPQDAVTASPTEGPRGWVRSGLESLFGAFAPSDRAASNMAEKVTNLSDFVNVPQEAFDIGTEIGNTLQGGDPRMLAMSLIPGKAADEVVPAVKQAQKKLKAYHATRNDFEKFGPAPEYRGSTYLALTPEGAKKGSTGGAQDFPDVGDRRPQRLLEVELPDEGIQGLHWTPKEREWFDAMPERIEGDEALNAAFAGQPNNGNISWDDVYEPRQIGDRLYEYIKKPPKTYSLDDVVKTNRDIYGGQLPGYQDRDVETAKRLREAGMKGYLLNDEAGVSIAHIDPETLEIVPAVKAAQKGIRVYHGSPHGFEKFDISKIGTGEGHQAFGHGLYFAENEGIARGYRDALTAGRDPRDDVNSLRQDWQGASTQPITADSVAKFMQQYDNLRPFADDKAVVTNIMRAVNGQEPGGTVSSEAMFALRALDKQLPPAPKGHMYEVNINADPDAFLDWDKPLSEQSGNVQEILGGKFGIRNPDRVEQLPNGRWAPMAGEEVVGRKDGWPTKSDAEYAVGMLAEQSKKTGAQIYESSRLVSGDYRNKVEAAQKLREAGIPGIKYLDAGSRATSGGELLGVEKAADGYRAKVRVQNRGGVAMGGAPTDMFTTSKAYATEKEARDWAESQINKGSRNYVVFSDEIIDIVKKYGIAGALAAGLITRQMADQLKAQQGGGQS